MSFSALYRPLACGLVALVLLVGGLLAPTAAAAPAAVTGGMSLSNLQALEEAGVEPGLGSVWVGPWHKNKWHEVDDALKTAREHGVTPVVQWYYWGDDISPSCVDKGCWSDLHDAKKTRGEWNAMAETLAKKVHEHGKGERVIVVLETEFNKQGIEDWEPFDGHLVEQAEIFREHAPNAVLVLGFGSWDQDKYHKFDRAIAATDWLGFQDLAGNTRDSDQVMRDTVDRLAYTSRVLHEAHGKPTFLAHFAVSTHGGEKYEKMQADVLREFFERLPELEEKGMKGFLYRDLQDNPNFDLANYYGPAERHWGLIKADGSKKPAFDVWAAGLKALRPEADPEPAHAPLSRSVPGASVPPGLGAAAAAPVAPAHAVPPFAALLAVAALAAVTGDVLRNEPTRGRLATALAREAAPAVTAWRAHVVPRVAPVAARALALWRQHAAPRVAAVAERVRAAWRAHAAPRVARVQPAVSARVHRALQAWAAHGAPRVRRVVMRAGALGRRS